MNIWCKTLIANGNLFLVEKSGEEGKLCIDIYFYHNRIRYYFTINCPDKDIQDDVFDQITEQECKDMYNENAANLN